MSQSLGSPDADQPRSGPAAHRRRDVVREIARDLRRVVAREAHHVVFQAEEPFPYYVQFTTDPGVFWGEAVSDRFLEGRARLGRRGGQRLATLGWRAPGADRPNWFQYFHPVRKRDHRLLAEHVLATFEHGYRWRGRIIASLDDSVPAGGRTFAPPASPEALAADDAALLDTVEQIVQRFGPERCGTHLEFTIARRHHRVRLAVSAAGGTVTCAALHLPDPDPAIVRAALDVNPGLARVPYTYEVRPLARHGDALALVTKFGVLPEQRAPVVVGMLLYGAVESIVAGHRALHEGAWGDGRAALAGR
jgi:hypothetical protein